MTDTRELAKIDLNLLISLQVLLEENSVSRAAERLYITQPAMSKTLSRLRELFGDPLFTRCSHGMQPTPRAQELAQGLSAVLGGISQLVSAREFDPAAVEGEVTIALSEYIGLALLPALARRLQAQAPHLNLRIITRVENQLEQLALGKLDFAVHIKQARYGREFRVKELGGSPPALLLREGHPLCSAPTDPALLANYPVIRLYVADWEQLEIQSVSGLFEQSRQPGQGSLEISHLMTAMEVLRNTDYYMPAPAYLIQNEAVGQGITALPLPSEDNASLDYVLVAHERTENSPLHIWLWEQITCTIRDLRPAQPQKLRQRITARR
ncbi:LysR family transcriptional regulator [Pseudohalioglobus sediminis]|uniref:LysR family transcriptional regulator n=2 Tax=Pseudohalioglobus sediminis TaxID=2606449 RepID=A0A5B0X8Y2_9GAMM|nr:LysR family transcriptional regulator [Pseudohalioglobus sediminis]